MARVDFLNNRIKKLEKLLFREMAKSSNLEEENKRLKDGSLAEYYKNQFFKLQKEHVQLENDARLLKMQVSNYEFDRRRD